MNIDTGGASHTCWDTTREELRMLVNGNKCCKGRFKTHLALFSSQGKGPECWVTYPQSLGKLRSVPLVMNSGAEDFRGAM